MLDVSQAELVRIPIDEIIPDIIQPRQTYDTTALNRLAYSLRNFGLLNPLWIERKDKADALSYIERWDNSRIKEFYTQKVRDSFSSQIMLLLVGHRRWLAGLKAGYNTIDCFVYPGELDVEERRIIQLHENIYVPLKPWERAEGIVDVFNLTNELGGQEDNVPYRKKDLAVDFGASQSTIGGYFRFAENTAQEIQELVKSGKLKFSDALTISRLPEKEQLLCLQTAWNAPGTNLRTYVEGILDERRAAQLDSDESGMMLRQQRPAARKDVPKIREMFYECNRIMRIALKMGEFSGENGMKSEFERFYDVFTDFSDKVKAFSGERRGTDVKSLRKLEKLEGIIEESLDSNRINRLEAQPAMEHFVRMMPLEMIIPDGDNPREEIEQAELKRLADSIEKIGLLNPVHLRIRDDGKYNLDAGNRRFGAHKILGRKEIAAYILDELPRNVVQRLKIDENYQQPPSPEENALCWNDLYNSLSGQGLVNGVADFSKEICQSESTVRKALSFEQELNPEVKELVYEGVMSYTMALNLIRLGYNDQLNVALSAVLDSYNTEKLRRAIKNHPKKDDQQLSFVSDEQLVESFRDYAARKVKLRLGSEVKGLRQRIESSLSARAEELCNDRSFVRAFWKLYDTVQKVYAATGEMPR